MRNILKIVGLPLLAMLLLGSFPATGASRDTNVRETNANVQVEQVRYHYHPYYYRHYHHRRGWGWDLNFYA
jgi:hypothetical protein